MKLIKRKRNFFELMFVPQYDELSLFSMGYMFVLFVVINNPPTHWDMSNIKINLESLKFILFMFPFSVGMLLCIYHAFTDRKKTSIEKKLMIFFAAIINGFSGIWGGTYILVHNSGWGFSLFPVWNIISGFILLTLLRSTDFEEKTISNDNVSLSQLFSSTVILSGIFYLCYFAFQLTWAATFSICIAWTTNLYSTVNSLMFRERIKILQV